MPKQVRARFYVSETKRTAYSNGVGGVVVLNAVSRGDKNAQWASATPSGKVEMTINNPSAFAIFDEALGKDVDITFTVDTPIVKPGDGHAFRQTELEAGVWGGGPGYCGECSQKHEEVAPTA